MANQPGHKRIATDTAVRGPYVRKHILGTQRREVEGYSFRDTYRTQCHEMYDFIGAVPSTTLVAPIINGGSNTIATTGTSTATFVMPSDGLISAVSYGSASAFTQNNTNFFTFTSNDARTSSTVLGTATHVNSTDGNALAINGGTNLSANTDYALTLSAAGTRTVKAGDVLTFTATVTGTLVGAQNSPYIKLVLQNPTGSSGLSTVTVAAAGQPTIGIVSNTVDGEFLMQLSSTSEAETVALTNGDQLNIAKVDVASPILGDGPIFEIRVKIGGNAAVSTNDTVVFGLATAFNSTLSSITEYVWFKLTGNMNVVLESNDGTLVNTAVAPTPGTTTLTAGTYYYFTINMGDQTGVTFWYDPTGKDDVFLGSLSMTNLTTAMLFQPFVAVQRSSGTDAVDVTVDVLSVKWPRY